MALKDLAKMVNQATKVLPVEDEFLRDLEYTISRISSEEQKEPSQTYKPSSLGGCLRNIYFQVTGAKRDDEYDSAPLIGMGESGTDRHSRLQAWIMRMKELNIDCEYIDVETWIKTRKPEGTTIVEKKGFETKCYNSILNMSFLCDGIIKYKGIYYVLEIKTETSFKYQIHSVAHEKHRVQGTAYSVCLGIDRVMFLYENRDLCIKKCDMVIVTDDMKQDLVIAQIETCENFRQKGQVPPKTMNIKDCKYCDYTKECEKW